MALIIRHTRSSATLEVLDPKAVKDMAQDITDNTYALAEKWQSTDLPGDSENLLIMQQQSRALLLGEIDRVTILQEQLQHPEAGEDPLMTTKLEDSLTSLYEAQSLLEYALEQAGVLLGTLSPLTSAEAAYKQGRDALISALQHHNQVVAAGSNDFSRALQEAASALTSLQQAEALLLSQGLEALNRDVPLSKLSQLKTTTETFMEACRKGEANDIEGHNSMMEEAYAGLSNSPTSILKSLNIGVWLQTNLTALLDPVFTMLDETRTLLSEI